MKKTLARPSAVIILSLLFFSSCSTLVGNVKPVDEKSRRYRVEELSGTNWKKLDPKKLVSPDSTVDTQSDAFSSEVSDLSYQSVKTAAIISLNSSCREGRPQMQDLGLVTRELLLGIGDVTEKNDRTFQIEGVPALETTIAGKIGGQSTKIRTVVLSKDSCVYDIMYVSQPAKFAVHEADFTRFVSSLRLR